MKAEKIIAAFDKKITADMDWRLSELAIFREMLANTDISDTRKSTLFRAAWALLYAHYEGYSKFCLDNYIELICNISASHLNFSDKTFVYFIDAKIKKSKSFNSDDTYLFFKNSIDTIRKSQPTAFQVDTKSNLWPKLLGDILTRLELENCGVLSNPQKLHTLVARRNDIAHGKKVFIEDLTYYLEYENEVQNTMYGLALAVVEKAAAIISFTPTASPNPPPSDACSV